MSIHSLVPSEKLLFNADTRKTAGGFTQIVSKKHILRLSELYILRKSAFKKFFQSLPLADFPNQNLVYAFSSRYLKNMSLSFGDTRESLNNRRNFLGSLGIDYRDLVCIKQVHGSHIRYAREKDRGKGTLSYDDSIADTDALVSNKKNLPLAIFTADCLSIFLYDAKTSSIGLIHAGWRGTKENITTKTIQLMKERFNTQSKDLYAGFGPAIRGCCYEVGEEFNRLFPGQLLKRNGHNYLDLVQINKGKLLDMGLGDINIFDSNICTSCQNKEFFSYRKEGNGCGRMISVIMLR